MTTAASTKAGDVVRVGDQVAEAARRSTESAGEPRLYPRSAAPHAHLRPGLLLVLHPDRRLDVRTADGVEVVHPPERPWGDPADLDPDRRISADTVTPPRFEARMDLDHVVSVLLARQAEGTRRGMRGRRVKPRVQGPGYKTSKCSAMISMVSQPHPDRPEIGIVSPASPSHFLVVLEPRHARNLDSRGGVADGSTPH